MIRAEQIAKKTKLENQIATARNLLGERLWKVLCRNHNVFKYVLTQAIRDCKGRKRIFNGKKWSITKLVDYILDTQKTIDSARELKRNMCFRVNKWGHVDHFTLGTKNQFYKSIRKFYEPHGQPRKDIFFTVDDLRSRMDKYIEKEVTGLLYNNYRMNSHGLELICPNGKSTGGLKVRSEDDWDYYSKRSLSSKVWTYFELTLGPQWWLNVKKAGLAICDGMLTVSASLQSEGLGDIPRIYKASWLVQSAGYNYRLAFGYIGVLDTPSGQLYYHSEVNPRKAYLGVLRKDKKSIACTTASELLSKLLKTEGQQLIDLCKPLQSLTCTVHDARLTGSCESGIESWCNTAGLPYRRLSAPFLDVLSAYHKHPNPNAKLALRHCLKRYFATQ